MKNKYIIAAVLAVIIVMSVAFLPGALAGKDNKGNGAPNGPHYNLNIIGAPKEKGGSWADDYNHDNGHRIFVPLYGRTAINLVKGDTFDVIDADGTDGKAKLQLEDPYPGDTTNSVYEIYVRALGKPGGKAVMTSYFEDADGNQWYSVENVELIRKKGQSRFDKKTLELTTILLDTDGDGIGDERHYLFDEEMDYFWEYDNKGLKHAQLRFYLV